LVCIGVALRGYRTIYPIAVLVISGGLLSAGWSWVIDTVLTENSSAWSSFLWVSPKLSYGGPAVFGGLASLIMALIVLPHYSQEAVAHNVGSN
jgi:TRAP-type C4-dicarboxylate transport system permease small subunit